MSTPVEQDPDGIWLTRPELTERLSLPPNTLAEWAKVPYGPRYAKFGKYVRYRLSDVIAWEEQQMTGGAA